MVAMYSAGYPPDPRWVSRARADMVRFAAYCGFSRTEIDDLELAVGEGCNNTVEHAGALTDFEVQATFDGASMVVRIVDKGLGFPTPGPPGVRDLWQTRGLGIFLMKRLMDDVSFATQPNDGTILTLEKHRGEGQRFSLAPR
jgi:anti-sigma regulatory factor (Ser/Thr protein kinase)